MNDDTALIKASLSQSDFFWSILIAIGLSILIAAVEIPSRAKTDLASCFLLLRSRTSWFCVLVTSSRRYLPPLPS